MKLKEKKILEDLLVSENYDKLAFWANGTWSNVGSGYGGELDGDNPEFCFSRSCFYDMSRKNCKLMVKAIEKALQNGTPAQVEYEKLSGEY